MSTFTVPQYESELPIAGGLTLAPLRVTTTIERPLPVNPLFPGPVHFVPGRISKSIFSWQTGNPSGVRPS
jgi:hypothetical protein